MKIIPQDKRRHFNVGIEIGLLSETLLLVLIPGHLWMASVITLLVIVVISYGFELFSLYTGHGHYELMDAIAAIAGGIIGMATGFLIVSFL